MIKLLQTLIFLLVSQSALAAFTPFVVKDIRVEGLQRISAGTVFNYLPVKTGERFDEQHSEQAIQALFKTGFFKDVRMEREGDVLVVVVRERPSIASIKITGNLDIETDELLESLKKIGLAEGRVFDRSVLDKIEQELQRQYFSNGKYGVKIKTITTPMERNRIAVLLEISEGKAARIHSINIVGNKIFKDKELLALFKLSTPTTFSFITGNDQYSKQKIAGDLEALRSFYLDQGYLNFKINSTQVSITPDKKYIYVTVNISEGDQFIVKELKLAGNLVVPPEELEKLITFANGSIYSHRQVAATSARISDRLGDDGYAFANVNAAPEIDEVNKEVTLTFFIDPGKRVYVRRINMLGNLRTSDEVLRREARQMEGGWFSTKQVERSRARLEKLDYFSEVNVETPAVPGASDQVDVNFTVVEQASGNFMASVGYSQTGGVLLSASVQQDNFMGSGKRVGFSVNNSSVNSGYSVSYTNPYYTIDGISRGFSISTRKTDAAEANISDYIVDVNEVGVHYGIPLSEYNRINVSATYSATDLTLGGLASNEISQFVAANGNNFDTLTVGAAWTIDTRNRGIFADRGLLHRLSAEVALPGGDLEYYKLNYEHKRYLPLTKKLTFLLRGKLGYGDGYGDTTGLPFYEHFYAGGVKSVRGFDDNSLGPRDSQGESYGGSFSVTGGAEIIFPVPFLKDSKSVRVSAFVDIGNVYADYDSFDANELRYSAGISGVWLSPMGPLSLSLASPLNDKDGDETQTLQFSLGGSFY